VSRLIDETAFFQDINYIGHGDITFSIIKTSFDNWL